MIFKGNMKINSFLSYFCHRRPERSFSYKGYYFPVCARCTGIYLSMMVFFILVWNISFNSMLSAIMGIILLIPMGIDGTTQFLNLRTSNNKLRLITGLIGGIGLIILAKYSNNLIFHV